MSSRASRKWSRRSGPSNVVSDPPSSGAATPTPDDPLVRTRYRELTRKHLNRLLDRLFTEFTRLHFHIAWAPSLPHDGNTQPLPAGCIVCRRLTGTGVASWRRCGACGPKHLARTLKADGDGHRFTCRRGVCNHWFPIRVRDVTVGVAYLQALEPGARERTGVKRLAHAKKIVLTRSEFNRAGRLLRLIVQHVQVLDLAELRRTDLANAQHVVTALASEQARLRRELGRISPVAAGTPAAPASGTHAQQIVSRLMERVQRDYPQPITLQQCAAGLAMNAAYLSALFSRAAGISFKAYLTEVRLERARQLLLGDPAKNISEVAAAVGYSSENRFRSAFKKVTGLSPRLWREVFRAGNVILFTWLQAERVFLESAGPAFF